MTLLPGSKAAKIESLETVIAEANTEIEILTEKQTGLEQALAAEQERAEQLENELDAANALLTETSEALKAEKDSFESRCHARARDIAAEAGTEKPIEEIEGEQNEAPKSAIAQLNAIKDPVAQSNFYREHQAEIRAEMIAR